MNEKLSRLQQQAEQGDADAQYKLGCDTYALGASQKHTEITKGFAFKAAREYLEKAVAQGHEEAEKTLKKLNEDISQQVSSLQQEAEQGDPDAQYILSSMYSMGDMGVPKNNAKTVEWGLKAAKQGHAIAIEALQIAANAGDPVGQFMLGEVYYEGVSQNYAEAAKWFQKAAEQGHAEAQFKMGFMHQCGQGIDQSFAKAMAWYRKAAPQGHAGAQRLLSLLESQGYPEAEFAGSPRPPSPPSTPTPLPVTPSAPSKSAEPKGFGWFVKCLKHYADFKGRARRKEFWMFMLFYWIFLVAWLLLFNSHVVWMFLNVPVAWMHLPALLFKSSAIWYILALLLPSLAVGVRRLHDSGRSGGWMLLLPISFIPAIGILGTIWLLVLMCLGSQPGTNEYGSNPKGVEKTEFKDAVAKAGIDLQDTNAIYEFADKWIHDESKDRKTGIILLEEVAFRGHAKAINELYKLCLGNIRNE